MPLVIDGAGTGPLVVGQAVAVMVPQQSTAATYRLVIDGEPLGEPTPTVPDLVPTAGRHRVAVEITTGGVVEQTQSADIIAIPALPDRGFRAHLARFPVAADAWPELVGAFDALAAAGHGDLEVVRSTDVAGVADGVWLITVDGFADGGEAEAYCRSFELPIPDRCYSAPVVPAGS